MARRHLGAIRAPTLQPPAKTQDADEDCTPAYLVIKAPWMVSFGLARVLVGEGEVAPRGQGVGVVRAQQSLPVGQGLLVDLMRSLSAAVGCAAGRQGSRGSSWSCRCRSR